jgi:hypothetical protein
VAKCFVSCARSRLVQKASDNLASPNSTFAGPVFISEPAAGANKDTAVERACRWCHIRVPRPREKPLPIIGSTPAQHHPQRPPDIGIGTRPPVACQSRCRRRWSWEIIVSQRAVDLVLFRTSGDEGWRTKLLIFPASMSSRVVSRQETTERRVRVLRFCGRLRMPWMRFQADRACTLLHQRITPANASASIANGRSKQSQLPRCDIEAPKSKTSGRRGWPDRCSATSSRPRSRLRPPTGPLPVFPFTTGENRFGIMSRPSKCGWTERRIAGPWFGPFAPLPATAAALVRRARASKLLGRSANGLLCLSRRSESRR